MSSQDKVSAAWLAKQIGCDVSDLGDWLPKSVKPDESGNYDHTAAVLALFAEFREHHWFISQAELADVLKVTPARVSHMIRDGILQADERGKLPRRRAVANVIDWLRQKVDGGKEGVSALKQSKLEKENELLELQLAATRRKSLDADEVEKAWANILLLCRGKLTRLGNKVAPRLAFCKTEQDMEREIQTEVDEALSELSKAPVYDAGDSNPIKHD